MPTISTFYGILISMHFNEHNPPHIHAIYGESNALFEISTGKLLQGQMPRTATKLIKEFISLHRQELLEMWNTKKFVQIPGLD